LPISNPSPISSGFTPASNRRLEWKALPASVRHAVEERLGSPVIEAVTQSGRLSSSAEGNTLLHVDIRADNLLIAGDRVLVVDWPHSAIGDTWIDLLFFLPSVAMQPPPGLPTLRRFQLAQGLPALEWLKRRTGWK